MKKIGIKTIAISGILSIGLMMSGCTDIERGFATGTAVGVGGTVLTHENTRSRYSRSYYDTGYRNGCVSARGRWRKSSYYWRNLRSYRNGWREGYRRCR